MTAASVTASYLTEEGFTLRSWLLTKDHKRIAILYAIAITLFFFLGGIAATLIRLELISPEGDVVSAAVYNKLFTFHGVVMVWFFLVPVIPTTLGNFLLPLMIGAPDMAFPRLNLLRVCLTISGGRCGGAARRPLRRGSWPRTRRCASRSGGRGGASGSSSRRCAPPPSAAG